MKFLSTHISYHLSITKGRVDDKGQVEFATLPLANITKIVYLAAELAALAPDLWHRLAVGFKIASIGVNSLAFGLGV